MRASMIAAVMAVLLLVGFGIGRASDRDEATVTVTSAGREDDGDIGFTITVEPAG